jgi:23S rRNA (cytidine2498-2'-O)-methyltransferase
VHRGRAELIAARLPHVSAKPLAFATPAPVAPLGSWTLLAPGLMLAAGRCASPFPNGEVQFIEDRDGPPSRAYLKLWEAFVRVGRWPVAGELCLDLGASPGGWTWTLARLGARVIAVDKAPLDARVSARPNVEWREDSAFALDPLSFDRVDWLCSDVIGYPRRLLALVERWRGSGRVRNMVVTVKFQGETDHDAARAFAAIPGARLFHLHHNKHELTFALLDAGGGWW